MTTLSFAESAGFDAEERNHAAIEEEPSPAVVRALHADAVKLNHAEWPGIALMLVAAVAAAIAAAGFPQQLFYLWLCVIPLTARVIVWAVEGIRLRRSDPFEHYRRERQSEAEESAGRADLQSRAVARTPVATTSLMIGISVVGLVQLLSSGLESSVAAAGLVKHATRTGEWWRLLTASYLHANYYHYAGNIGGLILLGQMIEAYDRRPRVVLAYLGGVLGGGLLSVALLPGSSVGASGGVLGLAGYALVLFHRRPGDASRWLRGRVLRLLGGTLLLGIVGFMFIDNAAHLGGVVTGVLIGAVAIPVAGHNLSPARTRALDVAGSIAAAILTAGALLTASKLVR
jgi:membrane associated rhomboid family serine protease